MELLKDQPRQELGLTPHSSPPSSKAGDTVGVVRREDGTLHFFVNGMMITWLIKLCSRN